jgi:predicted P-loop ATPase
MKLTEDDYAGLERSFISREIADAAGIYRVISIEGRDMMGRKGGGDYSGLVFPYRYPGSTASVLDRLRMDFPPIDAATGKAQHKYLTAPGARNRIYYPPCDPALLTDVNVPVVISEGEKKDLALWNAALQSANGTGKVPFLPITFPGVWSFKGCVGIRTTSEGERVSEKGVIVDFSSICWTGRKATILFDANASTNPSVQAARRELARELTHLGAEVWIADLPAAGINGCDDYLAIFGIEKGLEVLRAAIRYEWRAELLRSDAGKILPVLANIITTLRSAPEWHGVLAFDEFALTISATRDTPWGPVATWTDRDTYLLVDWLQRHGLRIGTTDANAAIETVARDRCYHPVRNYLDSLNWDAISRIDDWLTLYLGTPTGDKKERDGNEKELPLAVKLTRAIAARWLISAVARIYDPGCQADHVLILEGPQGKGKSAALRILGEPFFSDDIADLGTKDAALGVAGVWLVELPELDAMTRAEVSKIKSFISRRTDRFRPPYGRRIIQAARQCVFAGSVNHSEYLKDETGGRRFWPIECGDINLKELRKDRDQLWAEAVHRYRNKEHWYLDDPKLIEAATAEQEDRYSADPWEQLIEKHLVRIGFDQAITTSDLLEEAIKKEKGQWQRADEMRVAVILRRLGWQRDKRPGGANRQRTYSRASNRPTSSK